MISLRNIFDGKQVIEDDKIALIRSSYHYKHFYVLVIDTDNCRIWAKDGDSLFCDWLTADDLNCEFTEN